MVYKPTSKITNKANCKVLCQLLSLTHCLFFQYSDQKARLLRFSGKRNRRKKASTGTFVLPQSVVAGSNITFSRHPRSGIHWPGLTQLRRRHSLSQSVCSLNLSNPRVPTFVVIVSLKLLFKPRFIIYSSACVCWSASEFNIYNNIEIIETI
jgi:hypothetical protein